MLNVAIVGYGNLGKGVEKALEKREDAHIVGIFSRRDPNTLKTQNKAYHFDDIFALKDKIDVCILCGGSANDLPIQTPLLSEHFNTVDSYDNHALIKEHQEKVNQKTNKTTSIISVGWDPGLFSIQRLYIESILGVSNHTFWGEGVSQGHSDAIRQLDGVIDAIQVTVPLEEAIKKAQDGVTDIKNKHKRVAYVVSDRNDKDELENEIKTMPHYFAPFETEVHFVTQAKLKEMFPTMPHGGHVIGSDGESKMEFTLQLASNPNFTAQVLVAYAYACVNMNMMKMVGAYTVYDVAPKYLSKDRFDIL
ncbi:MAG TPA: diaminopimelate dehydrogenase [Erysipelothrix sp.]|nr:diaminopimelate dehydrogenase [Erysipelothrix sp.]